ncbi:HAMP domain-containing protein [Paenibacillus anaericanus]|uniref:histidine kinase n=1 Tax=Paenibacillus anaericanus TaxID=170367 RepID=A0A3S1DMI1_9BACL|nr:ATP-binding protein [Paenibacillus anaericanus]RUT44686.1 HAMP domain-containing protein [Paenibacillus anaericanus]
MLPTKKLQIRKNYVAWKLVAVNALVMLIVIWLAGVSVKDFACVLVEKYQLVGDAKTDFFQRTMQFYLIRASLLAVVVATLIHFFFIKKILSPLKKLTESTRQLIEGSYPEPIEVNSEDEIGELTKRFNAMTLTLQRSEQNRKVMLSNVSHDLRTPLSNLNGYLEALSNGVIEGDRELYLSLLEESQHITRLVEQLHQLSLWEDKGTDSMIFNRIPIDEFITRSLQSFQLELQHKEITLDISLEALDIISSEDGLRQVLTNLIQNAITYNSGHVIWISGVADRDDYRLTISNLGESLPEEQQDLVFERFFQADVSRQSRDGIKGSGLGLAIVKEIMAKLGGQVELSSDMNKYSFSITIPLKPNKT